MPHQIGDERASKPADRSRQNVGGEDGPTSRGAKIFDTNFIVAHRLHEIAERRVEKAGANADHAARQCEHEIVLYDGGMRGCYAGEGKTAHAETISPAGKIVELDQNGIKNHGEGKAQHCEINAAEAGE